MTIRPITSSDANAWEQLRNELWPGDEEYHVEAVKRFFQSKLPEVVEVLLAVDESNSPIGFAELSIRNVVDGCATSNVAYLEGWYVQEPFRHQGLGRALMTAAQNWGRAMGCTEFASDTEIDNTKSIALHKALGFEETYRTVGFRKDL